MGTKQYRLEGLERWRSISEDPHYSVMPPLRRLILYVRSRSASAEELLDNAFILCEANLEIGREEFEAWQGLCVVDATSVFSLEGLGSDLCQIYGYDFWGFLRAMNQLAKRSSDPAQYHQCINHNLFSSPADDELVLERFQSLEPLAELRLRGCMVDTAKLLGNLIRPETLPEGNSKTHESQGVVVITPRQDPDAYGGYGRSLKLNMEGQVLVKGPYCLNVFLEQPLYWLTSVDIHTGWLSRSTLELSYQLKLEHDHPGQLRLLMATTARELEQPGRGERYFWLNNSSLPHDGRSGIHIGMDQSQWTALHGDLREAYARKCGTGDLQLMDQQPVQLILALEAAATTKTPMGQVTLPSLKAVANAQDLN